MAFSGNQITGLKAWGVMGVVQDFEAKPEAAIQINVPWHDAPVTVNVHGASGETIRLHVTRNVGVDQVIQSDGGQT